MMLLTFLPSVFGQSLDQTGDELEVFCPTRSELMQRKDTVVPDYYPPMGYFNWTDVPLDRWYWQADWQEFEVNGTDPLPGKASDIMPYKSSNGKQTNGYDKYVGEQTVFPAGFRRYTLAWYNEPALCMRVPGSGDKKIEVLLESDLENANFCIHDASDVGVSTNDVGDVNTCGSGQVYACFTAATTNGLRGTNRDFGFYISCQDGCEQMDMTVRLRVRLSDQTWNKGKTGVADDLEMWCEEEKGTFVNDDETGNRYYTYPTDLIPDEPSNYPYHIMHFSGFWNAGGHHEVTRFNFLIPILSVFCLAYLFA